ncbi:hypothetical protein GCM10025870_27520 [Agromyces marinus]|uniref:Uncharacterized protein n=1 Tax=Agromyces marinus TaxID=1389020 RepID=A0ABN6YE60_9MICO|nr:hypothetical protein GCM10025870_27520 [Agromyces marinus]
MGDRVVADGVVDDARPLPDPDEPGERNEFRGKVDRQFDHGLALALEELEDDDPADPCDREARETEQAEEEEFEREQGGHAASLPGAQRRTGSSARVPTATTTTAPAIDALTRPTYPRG